MRDPDLIRCIFTGDSLVPDGVMMSSVLDDRLGAGEVVFVDVDPPRSGKSHRHQFGFVREAWMNLPEAFKDAPYAASPEHLRKHALIACGFHHVDVMPIGSDYRADQLANVMRKADAREDIYSIVTVEGSIITRMTAESQKMKAMGRKRFQDSKTAILEWMADLIGVEPEALSKMGRKEAA